MEYVRLMKYIMTGYVKPTLQESKHVRQALAFADEYTGS